MAICLSKGRIFIAQSLLAARDRTRIRDLVDGIRQNPYIMNADHHLGASSLGVDLRVWRRFQQPSDPASYDAADWF